MPPPPRYYDHRAMAPGHDYHRVPLNQRGGYDQRGPGEERDRQRRQCDLDPSRHSPRGVRLLASLPSMVGSVPFLASPRKCEVCLAPRYAVWLLHLSVSSVCISRRRVFLGIVVSFLLLSFFSFAACVWPVSVRFSFVYSDRCVSCARTLVVLLRFCLSRSYNELLICIHVNNGDFAVCVIVVYVFGEFCVRAERLRIFAASCCRTYNCLYSFVVLRCSDMHGQGEVPVPSLQA